MVDGAVVIISSSMSLSSLFVGVAAHVLRTEFSGETARAPNAVETRTTAQRRFLDRYPRSLDFLFSSFTGYCVYDLVAMMSTSTLSSSSSTSTLFHHVAGALGAYSMMLYRRAAFFPLSMLLSELTVAVSMLTKNSSSSGGVGGGGGVSNGNATTSLRGKYLRLLAFLVVRTFLAPIVVWWGWRLWLADVVRREGVDGDHNDHIDNDNDSHNHNTINTTTNNSSMQHQGAPSSGKDASTTTSRVDVLPDDHDHDHPRHHRDNDNDHDHDHDTIVQRNTYRWQHWWQQRLRRDLAALPVPVVVGSAVNIVLLGTLNVYWTWLLVQGIARKRLILLKE